MGDLFNFAGTMAGIGEAVNQGDNAENAANADQQMWADFSPTNPVDQATMAKEQGNYDDILSTIREGGMNAADRASVLGILAKTNAQAKSNAEGAMERSSASGTATGTAGIVSDMMAEQAASDEAATQGAAVAGEAVSNRANLESLASSTGSSIQGQLTAGNESEQNQILSQKEGEAQAYGLQAQTALNSPIPGAATAAGQAGSAAWNSAFNGGDTYQGSYGSGGYNPSVSQSSTGSSPTFANSQPISGPDSDTGEDF
jgi:hypothetical protein